MSPPAASGWEDELRELSAGRGSRHRRRVQPFGYPKRRPGEPDLGTVLRFVFRRNRPRPIDFAVVAIYPVDAPAGSLPELVVPIAADDFAAFRAGAAEQVRGSLQPGSAAAFDLSGGTVFSAGPARSPGLFKRRFRL